MRGKRALAAVALVAAALGLVVVASAGGAGAGVAEPALPTTEVPDFVDRWPLEDEGSSPTTTIQGRDVPEGGEARAAVEHREPLQLLEDEARAALGEGFAGVWRSDDGAHHVAATGAAQEVATVAALGAEVHAVGWSLDELEARRAQLDEVGPALVEAGVTRLAAWWVDPAANAVVVEVIGGQAEVEAAARAVEERLGAGPWALRAVEGGAREVSRTADPDPHNGGARFYSATTTCTSGIPWIIGTYPNYTYEIATAGHCVQGAIYWFRTGGWFGTTTSTWNGMNGTGSNHVDAAMVAPVTDSQPYFYVGLPSGNGLVYQSYQDGTWQSGLTGLRTSGSTTGEAQVGTGTVRATNATVNFYDAGGNLIDTRYGLNRADCWAQAGDSGGPVFKVIEGGNIKVLGVIVADVGEGIGGLCYYTPVITISNKYGGSPRG